MYSASICLEDTIQIRKFIKPYSQKLWKKLGKVVSQLKNCRMDVIPGRYRKMRGYFRSVFCLYRERWISFLEEPPTQEVTDGILDFYFTVRDFLNISELVDENYVVYTAFGE